jgi:prevent-host-death family protein
MVRFAIELAQAETEFATLIQKVGSGAEVLITQDGKPVARLIPADPAAPAHPDRDAGSARGLFTVPDDFDAPVEDLDEYT